MQVPNSAGVAAPRSALPAGAVDSHLHIYDARFPLVYPERLAVPEASVAEYRRLQQRLGTSRAVVVQPAAYGTDNRVTVDAIARLGPDRARGIAVVHPEVADAVLDALHEAGIRGLRFSLHDPKTAVTSPGMLPALAPRIAERGWHIQLHARAVQILELATVLDALPCDVVFDHMARLPMPEGERHPAFALVARRLQAGRAWVKLSGPYLESRTVAPAYDDVAALVRAFVRLAPQRLVWGSDWPHPTERAAKPDDAAMLDAFGAWIGDDATRRRVLVDNACRLYGFDNP